jgi:hypothetical protein
VSQATILTTFRQILLFSSQVSNGWTTVAHLLLAVSMYYQSIETRMYQMYQAIAFIIAITCGAA